MNGNLDFGSILRDARESHREDLMSVARKVRIRPDILEVIEASDLEHMPPRGYSRNMLNAYAKYLGLNPTTIVKMYLDALYEQQTNANRQDARPSGFDMSGGSRTSTGPRVPNTGSGSSFDLDRTSSYSPSGALGGRDVVSSRIDSNMTMQMNPVGRRPQRSRDNGSSPLYADRTPENQRKSSGGGKVAIVVAVVVLLLVGAMIAVAVNMAKAPSSSDASSGTMNITGLPTTGSAAPSEPEAPAAPEPEKAPEAPKPPAEPAPAKTVISYSVADGETAYIEISLDGKYLVADDITGPASDTFDLTADSGELSFVTTNPDVVTLQQDGKDVSLNANDNGIAKNDFTFQQVLDAWNKEHGGSSSDSSEAAASE